MDRHSGSPTSHCNANHAMKKAGAGGKYTWGAILEEPGPLSIDHQDPNYDSTEEVEGVSSTTQQTYRVVRSGQLNSLVELEERIIGENEGLSTISPKRNDAELTTLHRHERKIGM